jgi:hypothetical protein
MVGYAQEDQAQAERSESLFNGAGGFSWRRQAIHRYVKAERFQQTGRSPRVGEPMRRQSTGVKARVDIFEKTS